MRKQYSKVDSNVTKYKRRPNETVSKVEQNQQQGYMTNLEHNIAEALFEVIIPSDSDPGAKEACAVEFLDNLLSQPDMYFEISQWRRKWRTGIKRLEDVSLRIYDSSFPSLTLVERTEMVSMLSQGRLTSWNKSKGSEQDQREFFRMVRLHAIQGFLSDPKHGGNKNKSGWKFIGFQG
jgi:hypothetical protein